MIFYGIHQILRMYLLKVFIHSFYNILLRYQDSNLGMLSEPKSDVPPTTPYLNSCKYINNIEIDLKISKQILTFIVKLYFYLYRISIL